MDLETFKSLLVDDRASNRLSGPLRALWEAGRGNWDVAHSIVQDDTSREAAWVHAFLHRQEGDLSNAAYWYRTAGKPVQSGDLDREWESIVAEILV